MRTLAILPVLLLACLAGTIAAADAPPSIGTISATPATVTGKTSTLRVTTTDTDVLTYTWSAPAGVTFSASNGTITGKTCTATFAACGDYTCTVTLLNAAGLTATASVDVTVVPTLTSLALTPSTTVVNVGATQAFTVLAKDQYGLALDPQPAIAWSATGDGSIDGSGLFTAGPASGSATITATAGTKTVSRTLRINTGPIIQSDVATTAPDPIDGRTAIFTAAGADDMPVDELLYTWSATSSTGKTVSFSPRRSILGEETTATFSGIGVYTITVVVSDKQGLTATSSLVVRVSPTATSLTIAPTANVVVNPGLTKPFVATVRDQFKAIMVPQPTVDWAVTAGSGSIGADGIYLAGDPGPATVTATSGAATASVTLRVNAAPTVASPVSTPTPVITGTTAEFTVQGADDDNVDLLSYSWKASGPKSVTFVPRSGTNAEATTATFTAAGTYTITATITDKQRLSTTSSMVVTVVQTPTGYALYPASAVLNPKAAKIFVVQRRDQFNLAISGATIPATTWSATGGTVDAAGRYVAGLLPGQGTLTAVVATDPETVLTADIRINEVPTVALVPATTGPDPTAAATVPLTVLGADDGGEANLRYTWTAVGVTGVTFSGATQNTTAARNITATVPGPGSYIFRVLIKDAQGLSLTADVAVGVIFPAPTSTPAPGTFDAPVAIALEKAQPDGVIRYTLDGSDPGPEAAVADASLMLSATTTVTARVYRDGWAPSPALVATYTIATQATPEIVWTTPAPIVYGTALTAAQLAATSPVDGTFSYNHPLGTVLDAGSHELTATFTPADPVHYTTASATVVLQVTPAPITITWATPASITWGTALGAAQLNATANQPGTAIYSPAAGYTPEVGAQPLSVTITPTSPNYAEGTATVTLTVTKRQPVLAWATPASLTLGTALSATQLNATADQGGSFTYTPPLGTVLPAGLHMLRALFVPADGAHIAAGIIYVRIRVIDPVPPETTYDYDDANRLTDRIYADGTRDIFGYDKASRLTSAESQRYGTMVRRGYDTSGRLDQERLTIDGATYTVGYDYDDASRLTDITYPGGGHVVRSYTDRNQLEDVSLDGTKVAHRTYDVGGRLSTTTWHPDQGPLTETRTYHPGSAMVATIQVPGVTDFRYQYDSIWRKSAEFDDRVPAQSQHFRYDDASRLTDWRRGATYAAPASTQTWDLSLVGDWNQTARQSGGATTTETREHTPVHEIASIDGQGLEHDYRGNLSRGLPYADGTEARYAWDVENRLAFATAADAELGATGTATYRYDALGRRVQKTVFGVTTTFIHAGAQVIERRTAPQAALPAAAADDDGDLVAANGRPPGATHLGGGGILAAAQQRVNFQPALTAIPDGFIADKGKALEVRSNALTYGWDAAQTGQVERRVYPLPQFDTHIRMQPEGQATPGSWSYALPNGTYAVVVVMGDPASRNQTNDISINGHQFPDETPATTVVEYRQGNFDGYIENIRVTDGVLTIQAMATAFDPKLCFVEIGAEGVLATQAERDRLAAVIEAANNQTARNQAVAQEVASFVYGSYVDEVLCYQATVGVVTERYFPHYNHLYSVAALTDSTGAVTERFTYDSYGRQGISSAGGVSRTRSAVGWDRGFTGYVADQETGLLHARARQYSPTLGRFISRDDQLTSRWAQQELNAIDISPSPLDSYPDGISAYLTSFVPNGVDAYGNSVTLVSEVNVDEDSIPIWRNGWPIAGRGKTGLEPKVEYAIYCNYCDLTVDIKMKLTTYLLSASHADWSIRARQYNAKWGAKRANGQERWLTWMHERDHRQTYYQFFFEIRRYYEPHIGKYTSEAKCLAAQKILLDEFDAYYAKAQAHSAKFDQSPGWDAADEYINHPFTDDPNVSGITR